MAPTLIQLTSIDFRCVPLRRPARDFTQAFTHPGLRPVDESRQIVVLRCLLLPFLAPSSQPEVSASHVSAPCVHSPASPGDHDGVIAAAGGVDP